MVTSELTDAQWEKLRPLLPPQKPRTGRPAHDHRTVLNGILWVSLSKLAVVDLQSYVLYTVTSA